MTEQISFHVGVVLPAAGCGERMKSSIPKQFAEVNGRPLICYAIDCFQRLPWIQSIVIATSMGHVELLQQLVGSYGFTKVTVVEGGKTRHRSIHAGVKALQKICPDVEVVVIHDAVRPFISPDIVGKVATAAQLHGAAGVCRPLVSTVIARDEDQQLVESLDRSRYVNSEMPQAFQLPVIAQAYSQCSSEDLDYGTECLLLAMKYGNVHAKILDGSSDLWKVTYRKDLLSADAMIRERMTQIKVVNGSCQPEFADSITALLQSLQYQVSVVSDDASNADSGNVCEGDANSGSRAANTFVVLHTDLMTSTPKGGDKTSCDGDGTISENKNSSVETTPCSEGDSKDCSNEEGSKVGAQDTDGEASVDDSGTHLVSLLTSSQNQCMSPSQRSLLVGCSFVHVFVAANQKELENLQISLSRPLLKLAREGRDIDVMVYGILTLASCPGKAVGEMVGTVVQHVHRNFSGQLFMVDDSC